MTPEIRKRKEWVDQEWRILRRARGMRLARDVDSMVYTMARKIGVAETARATGLEMETVFDVLAKHRGDRARDGWGTA